MTAASSQARPSLDAVIVAAGASRRMGFDKLLTPVVGVPLIAHTVRAFEECADVARIVLVVSPDRAESVREALPFARKLTNFVTGGETRQESVWNGLEQVSADFVAVHDAARPLVTPTEISRCFDAAIQHGAATLAEPVADTLQRTDEEGRCTELVDREGLWRIQTPQIFETRALRRACEGARNSGIVVTDETSAFQRTGGVVFVVENREWNFKVTYPRDVAVAEFILQSRAAASLT